MTDEAGQRDPSGKVRASDAEREAVVERLRVATAEGRLTFGELAERTEAAWQRRLVAHARRTGVVRGR
jgi:hypothetical protein